MSCFNVQPETLDLILTFMKLGRFSGRQVFIQSSGAWVKIETSADAERIGWILTKENQRSVNHRYSEDTPPLPYRFTEHRAAFDAPGARLAAMVLKACSHFDYQASECPDYDTTDAARIIRDIQKAAIRTLPHFEDADPAPQHDRANPAPISLFDMARGAA